MFQTAQQIGPYLLIKRIGRGGFGEVWLAERRTPIATTKVALKMPLDSDADIEVIKREATLWAAASGNANVLPIIEANIYDSQIVIVSEYAPDGSLSEWLAQFGGGAPSVEQAIQIICGMLAGLQHLHSRRIIHRDLKPSNILLQGETPRLTDFGISRVLSTSQSKLAAGTPAYMAPEAFDGVRSEQTDLWSAGVILYQLLIGDLPFPQTDLTSLMAAIVNQQPAPVPPSISADMQAVIMRALSKRPERRYQSAAEMRAAVVSATGKPPEDLVSTMIDPRNQQRVRSPIGKGSAYDQPKIASIKWLTIKRLFSELFYGPDEDESFPPNVIVSTALRWRLEKTWTIDYQSAPTAASFDGKTLASYYGMYSVYDGPVIWSVRKGGKERVGRIYLWHIPTGAPLGAFVIDKHNRAGAFSSDMKLFACYVGGLLGPTTIKATLWNTHTGKINRAITVASDQPNVDSMAFSRRTNLLACSCSDGTIKLVDLQTDAVKMTLVKHSGYVGSLAFSPNDDFLAVTGPDGLRLWRMTDGKLVVAALGGQKHHSPAFAFSPDSEWIAGVSADNSGMLWRTKDGELHRVLNKSKFDTKFVTFTADGELLASPRVGKQKGLGLYNVNTGELRAVLDEDRTVFRSAFSPDNTLLVNWCSDRIITLWSSR